MKQTKLNFYLHLQICYVQLSLWAVKSLLFVWFAHVLVSSWAVFQICSDSGQFFPRQLHEKSASSEFPKGVPSCYFETFQMA